MPPAGGTPAFATVALVASWSRSRPGRDGWAGTRRRPAPAAASARRSGSGGRGTALPRSGATAVRSLVVSFWEITSVGLRSNSETIATITGVTAAASGVPASQKCEVTTAAVSEAMLAITSVLIDSRRSSSRVPLRAGEAIADSVARPAGAESPRAGGFRPASPRYVNVGRTRRKPIWTRDERSLHGEPTRRTEDCLPGDPRRRAGGAHRAVEGGGGRGWNARADLARGRRGPGVPAPRQGRHLQGRPDGGRGRSVGVRRARTAGRRGQPGLPAHGRGRGAIRPRLLRGGQAGRGDLPPPLDDGRGRRRPRPHRDLVAEPPDRHPERRRRVGRRGVRRRLGPRDEPQARRPPGLLRQGGRGGRRGRTRGAGGPDRGGPLLALTYPAASRQGALAAGGLSLPARAAGRGHLPDLPALVLRLGRRRGRRPPPHRGPP